MSELADLELGKGADFEPTPPQQDPRKPKVWLLLLVLLAAGLGVFLWWQLQQKPEPPPALIAAPPPAAPPEAPPANLEEEAPNELALPPLDESDNLLRELMTDLVQHPRLARWLAPQGLARSFVAAVDNVAEGISPRKHLSSLAPGGEFQVVERGGELYPAPQSFSRYDSLAAFAASLDAEAAAQLYRGLEPLFDEAYRDLGYPDRNFRQTLGQGIRRLLETPVPSADEPLVRGVMSYEFVDPKLENLSDAQRQFLRMGPANVRPVQAKLREISTALGL